MRDAQWAWAKSVHWTSPDSGTWRAFVCEDGGVCEDGHHMTSANFVEMTP